MRHNCELDLYIHRMQEFYNRLHADIFFEKKDFRVEYCVSTDPVLYTDRLKKGYQAIKKGEIWGKCWENAWFHLIGEIPAEWAGKNVALKLNFGGEALIFDEQGVPVFGLSDGSALIPSYTKELYQLPQEVKAGEKFEFWVEATANYLLGLEMDRYPTLDTMYPKGYLESKVKEVTYGLFNYECWQLILDMEVILSLFKTLQQEDYRKALIIEAVSKAINDYCSNPGNAAAARSALKEILKWPAMASALNVTAVGHAHIDTAWLWPMKETIRKCARTFANQLDLIDRYPEYIFGASSPLHYLFTQKHYPELFSKIKQRVKAGNWELQGGMWVEADCNLINGESMVRQLLHGKNFFMDEFGIDVRNVWLPDVFGYSAALPQILKKAKCDYFLTQKLSWNQINDFPYHTFMWRGIDNSRVLTHFPPENSYNADLTPALLTAGQNRYNEGSVTKEFLSLFGVGDGGGGPKDEYIERGLRLRNLEGVPKVHFGRADEFFDRQAQYTDKLPEWVGELYLERHRGTLTSQAKNKYNNRKLEQLLTVVEFISSCLPMAEYPREALDKVWKTVLTNQFHDIIPGSSIQEVYDTTDKEYAECFAVCKQLIADAADKIFEKTADSLVLLNSLSYCYNQVIELPPDWLDCRISDDYGNNIETQNESGRLFGLVKIPSSSFLNLHRNEYHKTDEAVNKNGLILENDLIRYTFNADGGLLSAFDKELQLELIPDRQCGNLFSLYNDTPSHYEAWDIDVHYEQEFISHAAFAANVTGSCGAVRSYLEFQLKVGQSSLQQKVILEQHSKQLNFVTKAQWHEDRKMLRVSFPVNIFVSEASFDIQYGYIKRPTHRNTSHDIARFETVAHRYVDISDHEHGVALLNDCKYGHKVHDNIIDLCLLRASKFPDMNADQGNHEFTYSLFPHAETFVDSRVIHQAACLNREPVLFEQGCSNLQVPCSIDSDNITLEVLKKAEKEEVLVIRLVENKGKNSKAIIKLPAMAEKLIETDLLEWDAVAEYSVSDGQAVINMKPFEIKTYKII